MSQNTNPVLSCAGFVKYVMNVCNDPNYAFMCDMVCELLDSIFMYRAGVRSGHPELMECGMAIFGKVWASRNHTMYRSLEAYHTFLTSCMPDELEQFVSQTMSIN